MKWNYLLVLGLGVSVLQFSCGGKSSGGSTGDTGQSNSGTAPTPQPPVMDNPATPSVPSTPSTPTTPSNPSTPATPSEPATPTVPTVPPAPTVPQNPPAPSLPPSTPSVPPVSAPSELFTEFQQWKNHYKKYEPYSKVTDNRGDGDENLYGTRNFRVVLHGVYYRGGANNKYHRSHPRSSTNPLPTDGLTNLCEEGFSTAIYYYPTNFSKAPQVVNCGSGADANTLNYKQINALSAKNQPAILHLIYDRIKGKLPGPIYGHCWDGLYASGVIAAISLRQFCDWTAAEAKAYWRKTADGNTLGHTKIEAVVSKFKPITALKISVTEQAAICPEKTE